MKGNNSKGAFERARQRWLFAAMYVCRRLGRGATGAIHVAGLLVEHTSRELFYSDGDLIAFPSLDRLALFAKVDEKTVRNGRDRLEAAGLLRTKHRFDNSNYYCLTIPAEAEDHLFHCEMVLKRDTKLPTRAPVENDTKLPTTDPDFGDQKGG